ncbi:MAG: thiolase domain-containing protein [Deltaproteobacteria bacterium]|nr:thiolase domain-containing protein [Deltaproteobacteria bacterium]
MPRPVAIVGTGQTRCGKRLDVSYPELIREAVVAALKDAGISFDDVQAVVTGSMPPPMEGVNGPHLYWADAMGAVGKPLIRVATCGSTGVSIAHAAFYHVASGLFDVVLAVGAEKMYEGEPQGTMSTVADPFFQRPFLAGAPGIFALQCNEYMHHYGLPEERVREAAALISVRNHNDALDNPYAHIKVKITVEDVLKSRVIAYPVRLLDVCPSSDGSCAMVYASQDAAKKLPGTPVWVKGVGYCGEEHFFGDSEKVRWQSAIQSAKHAYRMAGIINPRKELDVAEVYNPFTFQELLFYECFGFCDEGKGCELVEKGVVMEGGDLPCDPSGGVLCTNPIGATGLQRVAEVVLQIQGKAGAHQIDGVQTGLAHAMGGMDQFNGIMILGKNI